MKKDIQKILLEEDKPSLGQISFLFDALEKDEVLSERFEMKNGWGKLYKIKSRKRLRYWHYCLINNKYNKLNNLMTEFGFLQSNKSKK